MNQHPHHQLIEQLYQSFQKGDAAGMIACYHPEATFEDPGFGKLKGAQVGQMWAMLLERSKGVLEIEYSKVQADDSSGSAYWEAKYPFSKAKRKVHNKIQSQFTFKDGKIIDQKDRFSFWRWSSMALGLPGILLGFTPFLRNKVQSQSQALLKKYMEMQA